MSRGQLTEQTVQRHSKMQGVADAVHRIFDAETRQHRSKHGSEIGDVTDLAAYILEHNLLQMVQKRKHALHLIMESTPRESSQMLEKIEELRDEYGYERLLVSYED